MRTTTIPTPRPEMAVTASAVDKPGAKIVSSLARSDIFPGDAILEINNKTVRTPKDYQDAVAAAIASGKRDVIARVGCGNQERCGDLTVLRPIEIAAAG